MKKILLFLTFCLVITPPVLAARTTPAASDPDINMRLRGWGPATNITLPTSDPKTVLIDPGGPTDPLAPQLSTLLSGTLNTNPTILNLFQVNYTDGITPITTDGSSNWGVTLMEIDTGGLPVVVPKSGQTISSEGFKVLVLYASATDVTLQYTLEDGVACNGYTLHLVDFNGVGGALRFGIEFCPVFISLDHRVKMEDQHPGSQSEQKRRDDSIFEIKLHTVT